VSFSHALLAVGYSDQSQSFIVRNSWGEDWVRYVFCLLSSFISIVIMYFFQGDKGYCYIPYDYITNSDLCFDVWTVRKVATDDFGQDHWDNDDSIDYRQTDNSDIDGDDNNPTIEDIDDNDE
jgi:C1A family cysteine protease